MFLQVLSDDVVEEAGLYFLWKVSIKVELAELQVEIVGFGSPATLLPKPIS